MLISDCEGIARLRAALLEATREEGVVAIARAVGIYPGTVRSFINGRRVFAPVRAKLLRWAEKQPQAELRALAALMQPAARVPHSTRIRSAAPTSSPKSAREWARTWYNDTPYLGSGG